METVVLDSVCSCRRCVVDAYGRGEGGEAKKKKGREKNPHRIKHVRMIRVLRFEGERRRGGENKGRVKLGERRTRRKEGRLGSN